MTGSTHHVRLSGRKRALLVVLIAVSLLAFVEVGAAMIYFLLVPPSARTAVESAVGEGDVGSTRAMRFRPHPYLGYTGNPAFVDTHGRAAFMEPGIRVQDVELAGRKPGVVRIVAIGGSTTYGLDHDDGHDVWPSMLGAELSRRLTDREVEVVNAGVPSYTSFELILVACTWLPEWRPDVVLVHCGLNDAFTVGFADEGGPDGTGFRHAWTASEPPRLVRTLMRRSYALRLMGMRAFTPAGFGLGDLSAATQFPTPPADEVEHDVAQATGKYYRRNLETIVRLIEEAGAVPVLLTEPLNPEKETGQGPYYDAVSAAVVRNNGIMADVARAHGLLLVDLHARLRDPSDFVDACHETERGMKLKSDALAEALEPLVSTIAPKS